jgi:putative SOS response-associated peptidase YedK
MISNQAFPGTELRCLVIAIGFYEWSVISPKVKQPHYITLKSGEPMAMAGLWETWTSPKGTAIQSCTIVTTDANPFMLDLHDRMPVILPDAMVEPWLDPSKKTVEELQPILAQFSADQMQEWPVEKEVGNVRNQGEHLIAPLN